jgi:hypothetical protein
LDELAANLRQEEHTDLAERLDAMAFLARGDTGEALRRLRVAKAQSRERGASDRCRAALALGVGLAAAGRTNEALLEALDGLARAREVDDQRGERACARFIVQLADGAGEQDLAQAWQALYR